MIKVIMLDTGRSSPECLTEQFAENSSSRYNYSRYNTSIALYIYLQ